MRKKQQEILNFIESFYKRNRRFPTLKEIASHFNISAVSTVHEHLEKLVEEGYLKKVKRGIYELSYNVWSFPIIGYIAAGNPIEAVNDLFEIIDISNLLDSHNCYALKVKGNSMIDEHILNGDIIIVENRQTAINGEIAVVLIDNQETTLKKVYFEDKMVKLVSANPNFEPMYFESERVRIQGVVRGIIRNYKSQLKRKG